MRMVRSSWSMIAIVGMVTWLTLVPVLRAQTDTSLSPTNPSQPADSPSEDRRTISGTVRDRNSKPVQGARVWLLVSTSSYGVNLDRKFYQTQSNESGRFEFRNIEKGAYTLTAKAAGASYAVRHHRVDETISDETQWDLSLDLPAALRIRLTNESGQPVVGAKVTGLRWKTQQTDWQWLMYPYFDKNVFGPVLSDENGRITFQDLPTDAQCIVCLSHPDFAETETEPIFVADDSASVKLLRGSSIIIEVVDDETGNPVSDAVASISGLPERGLRHFDLGDSGSRKLRLRHSSDLNIWVSHPSMIPSPRQSFAWYGPNDRRVTFRMRHGGVITGRVLHAETRKPASGVSVALTASNNKYRTFATTDRDGLYQLVGPIGEVEILTQPGRNYRADRNQRVQVTVTAEGNTIAPNDLLVGSLPAVSGTVFVKGKPAEHALVIAGRYGAVTTDRNGHFNLPIRDQDRPLAVEVLSLTEKYSDAALFKFAEEISGKELVIELQPEPSLTGNVVSQDGMPASGSKVFLYRRVITDPWSPMQPFTSTVTKADGSYTFHGLNQYREYYVTTQRTENGSAWANWIRMNGDVVTAPPLIASSHSVSTLLKGVPQARELSASTWLNSPPISLRELQGKVVLIYFHRSSEVDRSEFQLLHNVYQDRGFVVIGVFSHTSNVDGIKNMLKQQGITYPVAVDNEKRQTFGNYDVRTYPTTILIDRDGTVIDTSALREFNLLSTIRWLMLYNDR